VILGRKERKRPIPPSPHSNKAGTKEKRKQNPSFVSSKFNATNKLGKERGV